MTPAVPRMVPARLHRLEVKNEIDHVGRQDGTGCAAGLPGLELPPLPDTASVLIDQFARGGSHGQFVNPRALNVAGNAVDI